MFDQISLDEGISNARVMYVNWVTSFCVKGFFVWQEKKFEMNFAEPELEQSVVVIATNQSGHDISGRFVEKIKVVQVRVDSHSVFIINK